MSGLAEGTATTGTWPASVKRVWLWIMRSPLSVAAFVLCIYIGLTLVSFRAGAVATDYALVGWKFAHQSNASSAISFGPNFRYAPEVGYDGQFYYFIALDPKNARYYIDNPAYRYERILYPLVARALALGQSALIPYTLILVNILAISGATLLLAQWLRRRGVHPWLALVYGLFSGLMVTYERDLTDALGYALVMLAIWCFDLRRHRVLWTGLCFGLAALAREVTLFFAIPYFAAQLLETGTEGQVRASSLLDKAKAGIKRNWRSVALMVGLAAGPYLIYKFFLMLWLGASGTPTRLIPSPIPFLGLIAMLPPRPDTLMQLLIVCAPGLICFGVALLAVLRRSASVEIWALLINATFFVVMLTPAWYVEQSPATTRLGTGIVLAAVLTVPALDTTLKRNRRWLAICTPMWLSYTSLYVVTLLYYAIPHL